VPTDTDLGLLKVEVALNMGSESVSKNLNIFVKSQVSKKEKLKVDSKKLEPTSDVSKRIETEFLLIKGIYETYSKTRILDQGLDLPLNSAITSPFGNSREYNGKVTKFHSGVDFRGAPGTKIMNPMRGKVVLSKDLYFTGNTIILDHGDQIFTVYAHLKNINVKGGEVVQQGSLLGTVGSTGRSTGPHLHWGVVLSGIKVDPLQFVKVWNQEFRGITGAVGNL
jgi:murein DD-endopeptidase MepM/ murein hydrolase activator NlpD